MLFSHVVRNIHVLRQRGSTSGQLGACGLGVCVATVVVEVVLVGATVVEVVLVNASVVEVVLVGASVVEVVLVGATVGDDGTQCLP